MANEFKGTPNEIYDGAVEWFRDQGLFNTEGPVDCTLRLIPGLKIHPIFAIEKFERKISPEAYKNMEPALLLASLLIQDQRVLEMPIKLSCATNKDIEENPLGDYLKIPRDYAGKTSEERAEHWEKRMNYLAQHVTWRFSQVRTLLKLYGEEALGITCSTKRQRDAMISIAGENPDFTQEQVTGHDHTTSQHLKGFEEIGMIMAPIDASNPASDKEFVGNNDVRPSCMLHRLFRDYFEDPNIAAQKHVDADRYDVLLQFQLAVTLCHELMHCVELTPLPLGVIRKGIWVHPWTSVEDLQGRNNFSEKPEVGYSWERHLFGGFIGFVEMTYSAFHHNLGDLPRLLLARIKIQEPSHKPGPTKKIRDAHGELRDMLSNHDNFRQTLIPLSRVASWFKKEHWAKDRTTEEITKRPPLDWKVRLLVSSTRGFSVEGGEKPLEKEKEYLENAFVHVSCYSPQVSIPEESPSPSSKGESSSDCLSDKSPSSESEMMKTEEVDGTEERAHDDTKRKVSSSPIGKEGRRPSKSSRLDDSESVD